MDHFDNGLSPIIDFEELNTLTFDNETEFSTKNENKELLDFLDS